MIANYPVDKDKFPYIEAVNYTDKKCIIEAFPHLKSINEETDWATHNNIEGLIIRSANDDNVHKVYLYYNAGHQVRNLDNNSQEQN